jgi:2-dehydro-3-deoxygluconokinase
MHSPAFDEKRGHSVAAMGEPMAEFSFYGGSRYALSFSGDSVNLATSIARLGLSAAVISAVGDDHFGNAFLAYAAAEGISCSGITVEKGGFTGIYFIDVGREGEHEFTYFRKGSAASGIRLTAGQEKIISNSSVFHFSGITQAISRQSYDETLKAVAIARKSGCLISYDLNFRPKLWGRRDARRGLSAVKKYIDIIFVSSEDHEMLFGKTGADEALEHYMNLGLENIIYKSGKDGSAGYFSGKKLRQKIYHVKAVDTTGAGDAFDAGFLAGIIMGRSPDESMKMAAINSALKCTRKGGTRGLPRYSSLSRVLKSY